MYRFLQWFPGRVVVLGLEADDSCGGEMQKAVMKELSSLRLEWNDNFWDVLELQSFGRFRTGRNLDLWNSVLNGFLLAVTSFAWVFIFAAWHVYGFHVHRNHGDLFCSFVKGCACIGSWIWIEFAVCHKFAVFLFCLRHWSLVDHILPVKMCGTHLGVVLSVIFVGSVIHLLRCCVTHLRMNNRGVCAWHGMKGLSGNLHSH